MSHARADYLPTLDGVRAVAIILVIVSHEFSRYNYLGRPGVLLFFALSGYLITYRLIEEYRRRGRISLRKFYIRRAFRILPPAVMYLAVTAAAGAASLPAVRAALLFYINYFDGGESAWRVVHFWSLSVEEHFYLLWPALLVAFGVLRGWRTAALLALAVCGWRVLDNHYEWVVHLLDAPYLEANPNRTDLVADALLWGCCLAFVPRGRVVMPAAGWLLNAGAVILLCAMVVIWKRKVAHSWIAIDLLPALALACVVFVPASPLGRVLEWEPVRFVGRLSYSLYIWQQLFVGAMAPPLALLGMFAAAYVSYRWIEQPCIRLGRRLSEPRRPSTDLVSPPQGTA